MSETGPSGGTKGLSLNSVLLATVSLVVLQRRHGDGHLARVVSFASLRPDTEKGLGCFISMLHLTAPFSRDKQPGNCPFCRPQFSGQLG